MGLRACEEPKRWVRNKEKCPCSATEDSHHAEGWGEGYSVIAAVGSHLGLWPESPGALLHKARKDTEQKPPGTHVRKQHSMFCLFVSSTLLSVCVGDWKEMQVRKRVSMQVTHYFLRRCK